MNAGPFVISRASRAASSFRAMRMNMNQNRYCPY